VSPNAPRTLVTTLVAAMILAGCGDAERTTEQAELTGDVTMALTSNKRNDCRLLTFATQRWIDQMTFSIRRLAVFSEAECLAGDDYDAHSVEVSHVMIDGAHATALITPKGGAFAFGRLHVTLVKKILWKLDRLTAIDVDRKQLDAHYGNAAPEPITKGQPRCRVRRRTDAELERQIVGSDPDVLADGVLTCHVAPALRRSGIPRNVVDCIVKRLYARRKEFLRATLEDQPHGKVMTLVATVACTRDPRAPGGPSPVGSQSS
jgi:hypothetical protein